jgi:hypothetical protein
VTSRICPDWRPLADGRAEGEERRQLQDHIRGCERCRIAAFDADPLLAFVCSTPGMDPGDLAAEVAAMQQRVAGALSHVGERRPKLGSRLRLPAAAAAAVVLVSALALLGEAGWWSSGRESEAGMPAAETVAAARPSASALLREYLAQQPLVEVAASTAAVDFQTTGAGYDLVLLVDDALDL